MSIPNDTPSPAPAPVRSSDLLAAMCDREQIFHRIGFLEGVIEGITLYAIWRDGEQLVGCLQKPLKDVLKPFKEEIARLTPMVANNGGEQRGPRS